MLEGFCELNDLTVGDDRTFLLSEWQRRNRTRLLCFNNSMKSAMRILELSFLSSLLGFATQLQFLQRTKEFVGSERRLIGALERFLLDAPSSLEELRDQSAVSLRGLVTEN